MNHIYQLIWSKSRHMYVVVSEIARRNGKAKIGGGTAKKGAAALLAVSALILGGVSVSAENITRDQNGNITINDYNGWRYQTNQSGKTITVTKELSTWDAGMTLAGTDAITIDGQVSVGHDDGEENAPKQTWWGTTDLSSKGTITVNGQIQSAYWGDVSKTNAEKDGNGETVLRGSTLMMTAVNDGKSGQIDAKENPVYAVGESTITLDADQVMGVNRVKSEKGSKITITDRNTSDLTFNSLSAVKGHLDISGNSITVNSAPSIFDSDIKLHAKNDIDIESAFVTGHNNTTSSEPYSPNYFYDYAYQKWMGTTSLSSDEGSVKIEGGSIQSYGKDSTFSISAKKDVTIAGDMTAVNDAGMTDKSGKKTAAGITVNGGNKVDIGGSIRANGKSDIVINAGVLNVAGVVDSQASGVGTQGPSHVTITADDAHINNTLNIEGGSEIAIHGKNVTIAQDTNDPLNLANNTHLLIDSTGNIVIGKEGNGGKAINAQSSTFNIGSSTSNVTINGGINDTFGNYDSNKYEHLSTIDGKTITINRLDERASVIQNSDVRIGSLKDNSVVTINYMSLEQHTSNVTIDGKTITLTGTPQYDGYAVDSGTESTTNIGSDGTETVSITGKVKSYGDSHVYIKGDTITLDRGNRTAVETDASASIYVGDEKTKNTTIHGTLNNQAGNKDRDGNPAKGIHVDGQTITIDQPRSDSWGSSSSTGVALAATNGPIAVGSKVTKTANITGNLIGFAGNITVKGNEINIIGSEQNQYAAVTAAGMAQGGNLTLGDDNTESANITGNLFANGKQVVVNADTIHMTGNKDKQVHLDNNKGERLDPSYALISYTGATIGRENATAIDIEGNVLARNKESEVKILGGSDHLTITGSDTEYAVTTYGGKIQVGSANTGKTTISKGGVNGLGGEVDVYGNDITVTGNDVKFNNNSPTIYKTEQKMAVYAQGAAINIGTDSTEKALLTGNVMANGGAINVLGKNITVNGDSSDYAVYEQGAPIQIGSETTANAEVNGGLQGNGSTVDVLGENVTLTQGAQDNAAHSIGANITVGIDGKTKADVTGKLYAEGGEVNVLGKELTLKPGKTDDLAYAEKGGKVTIGSASSTKTVMEGYLSTDERSQVEAWLNTNASVYTGTLDDKQILNDDAGVTLHLNDGGTWKETGHSTISNVLGKGGVIDTTNGNLTDSIVMGTFVGSGTTWKTDVDGSNNNRGDLLTAAKHSGTTKVDVRPTSSAMDGAEGKVLAISAEEEGSYVGDNVEGNLFWDKWDMASRPYEAGDETTFAEELKAAGIDDPKSVAAYWYLKYGGHLDPKTHPTTGVQTGYSADSLIYNTWRTENDKLLQRMGELRHGGSGQAGLWARIKGNEIHRDGIFGFKNKYNVYELGYDRVNRDDESGKKFTGFTFRYIDGDSRFEKGTGSNNAYGAAFYMTNMRPAGHYLDFIVRYDYFKTDYDVYNSYGNKIHGDPDANGLSASLEYGRKKQIDTKGWYVEPQTQLTMGYLHMKDYTTSDGVHMEGDNVKSAVWRGGFNLGREFHMNDGRKGNAYLKANWYHEFGGALGMDMSANGESIHLGEVQNDTWFEYGIGATFQLDAGTHIYFDYERGVGSDYKKDWTWDFGVRFEY